MIYLYLGTPGSGKSLHAAKDIISGLRRGNLVIANFDINTEGLRLHKKSRFVRFTNEELRQSPDQVIQAMTDYQETYGARHIYLLLDECQLLFDSRGWNSPNRPAWNYFFSQHRKYGQDNIDIILITQDKGAVDKRIRGCVEYEVPHRKISNCGTVGFWVSFLLGSNLFSYLVYAPSFKVKTESHFFLGHKKLFQLYNTLLVFDS